MSESIPEGWKKYKLSEIGSCSTSSVDKKIKNNENYVCLLNYMDVYKHSIITNSYNFQKVTAPANQILNSSVKHGDVFFTPSSETPHDIGHSAVFLGEAKNIVHSYHTIRFRPFSNQILDDEYKGYAFKVEKIYEYFRKMAQGATRYTLSIPNFHSLDILVPPLLEQKKIASILTLVDELIETTQKQIYKLQDLKKATMNELLTKGIGHTEFKESKLGRIPKSWKEIYLGELSNIFFSNVDKKNLEDEIPVLLCNYMDVYSNKNINKKIEFMKATAKKNEIDKFIIHEGDVIITKDSETPKDIAVPSYVSEELDNVLCGYHLALIRPNKTILSGKFLFYLFSHENIQHRYYKLANGSTRFGLTADIIKKSPLPLPSLSEQKKISSILVSIDEQIDKKQKKLNKNKSLKKSLMQDLLTGKVRVKVN